MPRPPHSHPSDFHEGGNRVSISYLTAWARCPRLWYWRYAEGLEQRYTPFYFIVGSAVHAGTEEWRASGWEDGAYNDAIGVQAVRDHMEQRRDEFANEDAWADAAAMAEDLFVAYTKAWKDEYPEFQVVEHPDHGPLIEHAFSIDIPGGVTLTVIPDVVMFTNGFVAPMDQKTTAANRVNTTITNMMHSPQMLAEYNALRTAMPDAIVSGVYVDVGIRGNTRQQRFQRKMIRADDAMIDKFPWLVGILVDEIRSALPALDLTGPGRMAAFPQRGMFTGACERCDFAKLCWDYPGRESEGMDEYRKKGG